MTSFEDLGLSGPLLDAVRRQGWDAPTALQAGAFAVLRRGGNAVLWASPGAGLVGAYALPLLAAVAEPEAPSRGAAESPEDASAEDGEGETAGDGADARPADAGPGVEDGGRAGPRVLVLTPTPDRAEHVARAIAELAVGTGILVSTPSPGWQAAGRAHVFVADASAVAERLSRSALKLGDVTAFVVEGVDALAGARETVLDAVMAALPPAAQRVGAAGDDEPDTRALVERLAPKAIGIPPRSDMTPAPARPVVVQYAVVPDRERAAALGRIVQAAGGTVAVHCRSADRAAGVAGELAARGFDCEVDGASVRVGGTPGAGTGTVVSYDVPPDAATFSARHEEGGVVFLAARELQHAERTAAAAGIELAARPADPADGAEGELGAFRDLVRRALDEEDLAAQTLVLAPLVEEHGPLRVAAALSALARTRPRVAAAMPSAPPAPTPGQRRETPSASAPAPSATAFTRLFISVGRKDGAGPGDIVGAIAGETGVAGDRIGRIELAETHAIAEIASEDARRVIEGLNGTTIRGRAVRVDYDRPRRGRPERRPRRPGPG